MLRSFHRALFRISFAFTPSSKLALKKTGIKSNAQYLHQYLLSQNINKLTEISFPSTSESHLKEKLRQDILKIYSLLYMQDPKRISNRLNSKSPEVEYQLDTKIKSSLVELSQFISKQHSLLSLKATKQCLLIMKKVYDYGIKDPEYYKILPVLEQRFYLLHDNYFLFEKRFRESIPILKAFTSLSYKLTNKEYLSRWQKFALDHLKNYTTKEICSILYIATFQIPENKEIYNIIKLQLFRSTPLYYQEVIKTKLYVNPKDYKRVYDFIKVVFSRTLLSSYERKGLYWEKDFFFSLNDFPELFLSYIIRGEKNGSYLSLLIQLLKQSLQESIHSQSDVVRYQKVFMKLLPVMVSFSEAETKQCINDYNHILNVFASVIINVIPTGSTKDIKSISQSFPSLWSKISDKPTLDLCMAQLVEIIGEKLELLNEKAAILDLMKEFNIIFLSLASVFIHDYGENEGNNRNGKLTNEFRNLTFVYLKRITEVIEDSVYQESENLSSINTLIRLVKGDSDPISMDIRKRITQANFVGRKSTDLLAFNYLLCFSMVEWKDSRIVPVAEDNFAYFVDYLIENLEVKSLDQDSCGQFFEIYANLKISNSLSQIKNKTTERFDLIQRSLLRYISDHYQEFSFGGLEYILDRCMAAELLESNFDDGSGLYPQNIVQELNNYLTKHLEEFSEDFQIRIKPYLEKYAEESAFETLTQSIKNISF